MDRLQDAFHNVSRKFGRSSPAAANAPHALPEPADNTMSPPPTAYTVSNQPSTSQWQPELDAAQGSPAIESHLYLPSIQLRRGRRDLTPEANYVAVHDYATSPKAGDQRAQGRWGTLWTNIQRMVGLRNEEEDTTEPGRDYDTEMVDALDTLGTVIDMQDPELLCSQLLYRSGSSDLDLSYQRSELTFRPGPGQIRKQEADILTHKLVERRWTEVEAGREG